jgi:hypothetical protein
MMYFMKVYKINISIPQLKLKNPSKTQFLKKLLIENTNKGKDCFFIGVNSAIWWT